MTPSILNVIRVALDRADMNHRATGFKQFEIDAAKAWVRGAARAAAPVAPAAGATLVNPYARQGSLEEAWRKGFEGTATALAARGSNYMRVFKEGESARRAARAAPQPATADARPFPAFVDGLLWLCVMDAGTIKPLDGAAALPVPGSWKSVMLENWATQKDKP